MKGQLNLYYDDEGDFLELSIGDYTEGYFKNLGHGIFERVDKQENVVGIAIMGFKKRTKNQKDVKLSLPVDMEICS